MNVSLWTSYIVAAAVLASLPTLAAEPLLLPSSEPGPAMVAASDTAAVQTGVEGYFAAWFDRVAAARASQPHWAAPLVTITPMLIEQVRYDATYLSVANGAHVLNYGVQKGLELIPTTTNEVIVSVPPYQERYDVKPSQGLADWQFLVIKQRLASANEQDGNYVVTAYLAAQAPTGIPAFSADAWVVTPTLGGGWGVGDFDVQGTFGIALPLDHESLLGTSAIGNVAFQYRVAKLFWPELEVNWTDWLDGQQRGGKEQVYLTAGLVAGTIKLTDRLGLALGAGYQVAVTPVQQYKPALTPVYRNAWLGTVRLPF